MKINRQNNEILLKIEPRHKVDMLFYFCIMAFFGFFACIPILTLIYKHPDFISMCSESVAYRYFFHERISHYNEGVPIIWQGYTALLLQKIPYFLSNISRGDIYQKINNFSLYYSILVAISILFLMAYASYTPVYWLPISIFSPLLMAIYVPQTGSGIYYYSAPDYYATSDLIVAISIAFSAITINLNRISIHHYKLSGLILGAAMANKISLMPIAMMPILACLMVSKCLRRQAIDFILTILLSFIICILIYAVAYNFNFYSVYSAVAMLLAANLSGGIDSVSLSKFIGQYLAFNDLGVSFILSFGLLLTGLTNYMLDPNSSCFNKVIFLLFIIINLIFEISFMIIRPAGTTIYECLFSISALSGFAAAITISSKSTKAFLLVIICTTIWYLPQNLKIFNNNIVSSNNNSHILRAFTNELKSMNGEIFIYFPDNNYLVGTLEETLLKAASDFPTWSVTDGKNMIERLYPGLHIITGFSPQDVYIPLRSTIAWISKEYEGMVDPLEVYSLFKRISQANKSKCMFLDFKSKEKLHWCIVGDY